MNKNTKFKEQMIETRIDPANGDKCRRSTVRQLLSIQLLFTLKEKIYVVECLIYNTPQIQGDIYPADNWLFTYEYDASIDPD